MRQRVDGADDEDDDDDDDDALTSVDHLGGQPRFLAASLSRFFPSFLPSFFSSASRTYTSARYCIMMTMYSLNLTV